MDTDDDMPVFRRTGESREALKERIEQMRNAPHRDFAEDEVDRGPGIEVGTFNSPKAGQWDAKKMSKGMVADYKPFVITDGEGVRCSIYVSGCSFFCTQCFNVSIWDYSAGYKYTQELEDRIIADLSHDYVDGMTFLGGEPFLNTPVLLRLAKRIRDTFGHSKTIWSWTGYTWEELMRMGETPDKMELLSYVDILVDGRFINSMKDSLLQFRGSKNQRIIDVPKSLEQKKVVIWDKLHDGKRQYKEVGISEREKNETTSS